MDDYSADEVDDADLDAIIGDAGKRPFLRSCCPSTYVQLAVLIQALVHRWA